MNDEREAAVIGRFADLHTTTTVPLGPCSCVGQPHGEDSAQIRAEIGDGELRAAVSRGAYRTSRTYSGAEADDECIGSFVVSWTLLDRDGKPAEINAVNASRLDEQTRSALIAAITAASGRPVLLERSVVEAAIASVSEGPASQVVPARELLSVVALLTSRARILPNPSSGRSRAGIRATASRSRRKPRR